MMYINDDQHFRNLLSRLMTVEGTDRVEALLLEIQDYVLVNYAIVFPSGKLNLMELEIYYRGRNYAGQSTHAVLGEQNGRCGMLYDHGKGGTRKGFDIVLSMSHDYFLSCLVKGSVYDGKPLFKQGVSYCKCQELAGVSNLSAYDKTVLVRTESTHGRILHSRRVGLSNQSDKDAILRSLNCSYFAPQALGYNLLYGYKGYRKCDFLKAEMELADIDRQEAEELSIEILGYIDKSSIDALFVGV